VKSLRISGRGLNSDQGQALQRCKQAFILNFTHPKKDVWNALRSADEIVEEIARNSGGLVWDEETREVFSPETWHQKRVESWQGEVPDIANETTIHIYNNGTSIRAITLGMSKIGMPDVVMESSGWSSDSQVGNLINLFGQAVAEGKSTPDTGDFKLELRSIKNSAVREEQTRRLKSNALGIACLTLSQGTWEEGDPKNRLVELRADRYSGSDSSSRQESMISSFFGAEDHISNISDSQELIAASQKAKGKLPELQKAFSAGLEPGEFIQVKAPFATTRGGREWMWVEVTAWNGDHILGLLENDPEDVPDLQAGQKVEVRQQDVFDYIHQFPDKRTEGNTTSDIIRKMDESSSSQNSTVRIAQPECAAD
jgi:uncharacterized protein YegJ (DUF2314 family)